jgi:spore coat protein U-like protein
MKIKHIALGLAFVISALPMAASAAGPTFGNNSAGPNTLNINVAVTDSCAFGPTTAISNSYDWQAGIAATTYANELSVQCNASTPYYFTADRGQNAVSTQNNLKDGSGDVLGYSLLVKDAATAPWDPAANAGGTNFETATGAVQNFSLVFAAPVGQHVPVGSYSDVVTFTLTY